MALTQKTIAAPSKAFQQGVDRGRDLYDRIAVNGMRNAGNKPVSLSQPDRRDAAQFIFFEVAAQFEHFCIEAFLLEVRYQYGIERGRGRAVMGSPGGYPGTGWAVPVHLKERGEALFGKRGFFARLDHHLGQKNYERLGWAHTVRNRVAHAGENAKYRKLLPRLIGGKPRLQGLGPGRLLKDYPSSTSEGQRYFHVFLDAYEAMRTAFDQHTSGWSQRP